MRFTTSFALASCLTVAGALSAAAAPAVTTASANVRGGPGTSYQALGTLPAGSPVDVVGCSGGWCQTQYGYIAASLLSQAGAAYGLPAARPGTAYRSPAAAPILPSSPLAPPTYSAPTYAGPAAVAGAAALGYGSAPSSGAAPAAPARPVAPALAASPAPSVMAAPAQTHVYSPTGPAGAVAHVAAEASHPGTDTTMAGPRTTIGVANVRSGPGVEYDVVKTLPDFTKVEVTGCANSWCQTNEGYISLYLLSRGSVQQVLSPAAQPRIPGSNTRDSASWNPAAQAAMGYGAAGIVPQGYPALAPRTAAVPRSMLAAAPAGYGAASTASTRTAANVRGGPGTSYPALGTLPAGSPVDVVGCTGGWCQTQYGYIAASLLGQGGAYGAAAAYRAPALTYRAPPVLAAPAPIYAAPPVLAAPAQTHVYSPTAPAGAVAHAAAEAVHPGTDTTMAGPRTTIGVANVRSGPGVEYDVVKTLPDFTKVEVTGCANSWCQTNEGYISLYLLSRGSVQQVLSPAAQPRIPGSNTRDSASWNPAAQAAMGYGAAGIVPQGYPAAIPGSVVPNYAAAARAYAPSTAVGTYGVSGTATTTATVNVRSGPGTGYDTLGTLPAGSPVEIVSCTGSWCQTQYGYVSARHVDQGGAFASAAPAPAPRRRTGVTVPAARPYPVGTSIGTVPISPSQAPRYLGAPGMGSAVTPALAPSGAAGSAVAATTVNVRSGPGTAYDVLGTLPGGSPVDLASCADGWCQTQYGYVSARLLEPAGGDTGVYAAPTLAGAYPGTGYAEPASSRGYSAQAFPAVYDPALTPQAGYATAASLPVEDTLSGIGSSRDGYGRGTGWTNWRTSWGPGYWGPALRGRNATSNWGARPSYWGGRTTFWNVHPGYPTRAYAGDRRGNMYWSRKGEGRLPQSPGFYYGLGPRWQGPYAEGPEYNGRPVVWRPRSGVW
ncbi:SH3 domain-containing protein [Ancylobacter sp. TS-1]|uniref:SH3 domain-containing protein n=1 Tax=Ancylobacter sp. TS-1 TaxID=1850374 RepID=UPI001265ADFC|nr:SH3 domain-containing protein [Ancylobacter sp. TS-1]QFR32643.1 SH3 domain-containing protein [Ancylobacter sp. TS-1]